MMESCFENYPDNRTVRLLYLIRIILQEVLFILLKKHRFFQKP
ncbi:hypothetical protein TREVI0001_0610 [Treponema vincentii ATCC 35580]|uniref:Uncharacterized protein n=1 Tax=Treponema vincentii ATCC 35580 TaxID=596324 RepID=C8PMJ5_9SPIR|nr:hypothetical protein TREVI0001_0610 [Treponema vincentii ATCC 35580]